jgi:four helix bundle protein
MWPEQNSFRNTSSNLTQIRTGGSLSENQNSKRRVQGFQGRGFEQEDMNPSQMRRAAVSIPSNIAEGYGRKTKGEYIQALYIAYGSNCELETQMLLSFDLGYIDARSLEKLQSDYGDVERMLKALIKSLENKR